MTLKLFVCTDHWGYYPVGTASIVLAENALAAQVLLEKALLDKGLPATGFTLHEYPVSGEPYAAILRDGDY